MKYVDMSVEEVKKLSKSKLEDAVIGLQEEYQSLLSSKSDAHHLKRIDELEDFLLDLQHELHNVKVRLQTEPIGRRFNQHYIACRTLLGEKGEKVDAQLRG
jgi:predicted RNA-binding Zn ribbon-like protein